MCDRAPMNGCRPEARKLLHLELLLRGFYLARRGFMSLSLPLVDADHDALVAAFGEVLDENAHLLAEPAAA